MIPVTKPFLPPIEEYQPYVESIWKRNWLTNNGPLVNQLELKLKKYLGLKHMLYLGDGTVALQFAVKALKLKGEVITTPFSYVATVSSICWEGCKPVFVDIDPESFNLDPTRIEKAITSDTSAILATHVYGNPCDIDAIELIAKKHNLKVIYDAAHCFGTKYKGKSVFEYGDISTVSFHATKLYHTIEGGAVFSSDPDLIKDIAYLRNFGHDGPEKFYSIGINGKNSEFHAAMGLVNLNHVDEILEKRRSQSEIYNGMLQKLKARKPKIGPHTEFNHAYYPLVFDDAGLMKRCLEKLNASNIFPRRYFYPSLSSLPYINEEYHLPVTMDVCEKVICLPLYFDLTEEEIQFICRLLLRVQNN